MAFRIDPLVRATAEQERKVTAEEREKLLKMTDAELAEHAAECLKHCPKPRHPVSSMVYDSLMHHLVVPEMVRRLRERG